MYPSMYAQLLLLWSLVEVHSQTAAPYVSFMGENLPNHAYVDLTLVGTDNSDPGNIVRCITDRGWCHCWRVVFSQCKCSATVS